MKKALLIKKEWLDKIFHEDKVWEMRTTKTKIRGEIGLIESGTGLIVGKAELYDCSEEPIPKDKSLIQFHKVENLDLLDKWKYAWKLRNTEKLETPIKYAHPKGAVIWVNLK